MQALIHGNFEGAAQRKAYALVGAAAAIAAAVGPLLGGFITTYLSWRIAFLLEDVVTSARELLAAKDRLEELKLRVTCCAVVSRGLAPVRALLQFSLPRSDAKTEN